MDHEPITANYDEAEKLEEGCWSLKQLENFEDLTNAGLCSTSRSMLDASLPYQKATNYDRFHDHHESYNDVFDQRMEVV